MRKLAIYTRVSTAGQSNASQLTDLLAYAAAGGASIYQVYSDIAGGGRDRRPQLDALMDAARKRQFDTVLVWRFDRFARSLRHLIVALEEFNALGIAFISYRENLDTGAPMGRAVFGIIGALAELERDIIKERIAAGLRRARADGKSFGRPALAPAVVARMAAMRAEGFSYRQIAGQLNVSKSAVHIALSRPAHRAIAQSPTSGGQ